MPDAFLGRCRGAIFRGLGLGVRLGGALLNYTLGPPDAFGRPRRGKAVELPDFGARARIAEARLSPSRRLIDPQMPSSLSTGAPRQRSGAFRVAAPLGMVPRRAAHLEADLVRSEPILTGRRDKELNDDAVR
jgi:hypothetical protein